ncbi:alanine racemase [Hydrogenophaga pseudoflava]|uniref:alanine racemase n=1 Tax=Hydrogenophaga pseudoflava TaxID=47421 RepID=UPI0027E51946|nr:alanine racemase [Hydrogenophaga pseudoflava]MDQ7744008.1 alanine racemase [Hydrogenophaga pseudoflava]
MTTPGAVFGHHLKGFPTGGAPLTREQIRAQGWQLLRGDLALPLAVVRRRELMHNLHWMRDFCAQRGLFLAPHGKTSMSPELWQLQLDAGAWGISFATVFQAAIGARHGVPVLLIANQVVQRAELDALAGLHTECPGLRSMFLVDSVGQVDAIEAWAADRAFCGHFEVLLELGIAGQRTGTRTAEEARRTAARIAASPVLQLAGIECYEGTTAYCDHARDRATVQGLMDRVEATARKAIARGWFAHEEIVLTAGGSAIFDLVAERLLPDLGRPVRGVLRSGCYLTHDHQRYTRYLCCVGERLNLKETLKPALEVLACVQSQPEPGLALLSMGKRDVAYDLDLPQPLWRSDGHGGAPLAVPAHWRIDALNDQHAYLRYDAAAPLAERPRLGETVASGISHPCTTFDKWRWLPVVDEGYQVVDAVTTWF